MDFSNVFFSKNPWKVVKKNSIFFSVWSTPPTRELGWAAPSRSSASISTMRLLNSSCNGPSTAVIFMDFVGDRKWRLVQWTANFNSAFRWYVSSSCSERFSRLFSSRKRHKLDIEKNHKTFFSKNASKLWSFFTSRRPELDPPEKQGVGSIGPVCPHWNDVIRSVFHGASGEKRWETTCNSTAGFQVIQETSLISY